MGALTDLLRGGGYLADRGLSTALYVALSLRRPLLLEGEVGVGKTEVAKALAAVTGRRLIRLQCYEGIDTNQALYEWDYARQMLHIRALSEHQLAGDDAVDKLFGPKFLLERPLLEAVRAGDRAVQRQRHEQRRGQAAIGQVAALPQGLGELADGGRARHPLGLRPENQVPHAARAGVQLALAGQLGPPGQPQVAIGLLGQAVEAHVGHPLAGFGGAAGFLDVLGGLAPGAPHLAEHLEGFFGVATHVLTVSPGGGQGDRGLREGL